MTYPDYYGRPTITPQPANGKTPTANELQVMATMFGLEVNDWAALTWLVGACITAYGDGATPTPPDDGELPEEVAALIPWLLEEAAQAANAGRSTAAGLLTLAAQLLGELPREGDFDGKTLLQVNCGNSGELEIALNPRRWTRAHHDAWHRHIPDVHKAFAALLDVAKQRTDPSATHCLPANANRVVPEEACPGMPDSPDANDAAPWQRWQARQRIRALLTAEAERAEKGEE